MGNLAMFAGDGFRAFQCRKQLRVVETTQASFLRCLSENRKLEECPRVAEGDRLIFGGFSVFGVGL